MTYNPDNHHRHSIRLRDYDYASGGAYFVTLCTFDHGCYFNQFEQLREIVNNEWINIPTRFHNVDLDEYVIMPNHIHGIIIIRRDTPCGCPLNGLPPALGDIVGAFKSLCVNAWLKAIKSQNIGAKGKFWQVNYYEHVIRNVYELNRIRQYIIDNPASWELDKENPTPRGQQPQLEKWMI
jgi:putative transposase